MASFGQPASAYEKIKEISVAFEKLGPDALADRNIYPNEIWRDVIFALEAYKRPIREWVEVLNESTVRTVWL
jgi:hypothetical protein